MAIYDESGYKVDIEDIFHELTSRLYQIDYQIDKGEEITMISDDLLEKVKQEITSYPYDVALATLKTNMEYLEQLLIKVGENRANLLIKGWWQDEAYENDKASALTVELNNYKADIKFLINRTETNQSSYINHLSNITYPKIQTNLTVEQIGGLLYFLIIHQKDIIKTNTKATCNIISKVIATVDSANPSGDNLRNEMYNTPKKRKVLDFWRDKFLIFFQDSQERNTMN